MFGTFGHQDPFVRQRNTFGWPPISQTWSGGCTPSVGTTPHTFGLYNSSVQKYKNEIRLSTLQQPFGQQKPLPFGQAQTLPFDQQKPLIFGQTQPAAQPIPFGQAQTLPFGQAQPIPFGQTHTLPFGQVQPAAHTPISKTTLTTRIVLVNPLQQNYDHISGEEYLLLNDLSLSIDYCQKLQRELQIKMNS